ncbi:MAG TPA: thermonuclease family protein, partial [Ilumatobacteraceae bacterium]
IDTPETKKSNTPVQCYGPEATKFTKSLLPKDVSLHLERDVVARDDFGRMLAYVYIAGDGQFVNLTIIRQGYARPLTIKPNAAHADEFVDAASTAQREHIGLWAKCTG